MENISIVIPVYQGEKTLEHLMEEILPLTSVQNINDKLSFIVSEVILVDDCGPDNSREVISRLEEKYSFVKKVFLLRNFGQHAATIAGIANSTGKWIATIDEDGQYDPEFIPRFIEKAIEKNSTLVYAEPENKASHGFLRNLTSKYSKKVVNLLAGGGATHYHSFRLIKGEVARKVCSNLPNGVYLDVALGWGARNISTVEVPIRDEGDERTSGYNYIKLFSHFWRMVLTSGTRGLRLISFLGLFVFIVGFLMTVIIVINALVNGYPVSGWASLITTILTFFGLIMLSLGIISEYIGVILNNNLGKPLYLEEDDNE